MSGAEEFVHHHAANPAGGARDEHAHRKTSSQFNDHCWGVRFWCKIGSLSRYSQAQFLIPGNGSLGGYLRERRTRLDPVALGYVGGRRRTPGLRREEVAQRAGISATWYSWLEQGRGGAPSAHALDQLA